MSKLHIDILLRLRNAGRFGQTIEDLLTELRLGNHRDVTEPQAETALRALADRSLVDPFTSVLQQKRWKILALGESALREAGL